jgi:hypothetical protein
MDKNRRNMRRILTSFGYEVISTRCNSHIVVHCRHKETGKEVRFTYPLSASCARAEKNFIADVKRTIG